jgi:DNA-binding transcriptional MerR regulator
MQKLYYSISEISELIDEEQHILRYWEKEFPQLKPRKNRSGNRVYSQKDISLIKLIRKLLRDDKLSLKGAKEYIEKVYKQQEDLDNSLFFEYEMDLHTSAANVNPVLEKIIKKHEKEKQIDKSQIIEVRNMLETILQELNSF